MQRTLAMLCGVAALLLGFCGIGWSETLDRSSVNPAAPLSSETGGVATTTPWVESLIADGMTRSPTFAGIATQLLTSNVLAVVEPDYRIKRELSGYMQFITRTSLRRYVRIYFDPRMRYCEQIAVVGHELRHALEVAAHPEVVNPPTLRDLYTRIGHGDGNVWDSDAGVLAAHVILRELEVTAEAAPGPRH